MMMAMSFVARCMKISCAGCDNGFTDPNHNNFPQLFLPGITDSREFIGQRK
jgi:hypothetical protein